MQIVIKLDKRLYQYAKHHTLTPAEIDEICDAIANGTPLPKGHGRLIDESKIKNCGWNFIDHHAKTDAPTIIEAESEV